MAWSTIGNIKGPKGDTGDQGIQGVKGDTGTAGGQGIQGPKGDPGIQGIQGVPGTAGADGKGISIAGSAATYAALPSNLGPADAGKGYLVDADGKLYIWNGTAFPANGSGVAFQGPKGDTGPQGATGSTGGQGIQGVKGDTGAAGTPGATGSTGATGPRGSKWYTGAGIPSGIGGSIPGDMYLDTITGIVYELT